MEAPIRTDTIVVASPGTGKTQEIANTVIGLLRSGVSSERIACMTFTNRAAREMIQRIISVAGEDPEILRSIYTLDIGTMHSLAYGEDESGQPGLVSNSLLRFIIYRKIIELGTFTYSPDTIRHMIIPKLENMIRYVKSFGIYPDEIDMDRTMGILLERLKQEEKEDMGEPEYHRLLQDFIILFSHYEDYKKRHSLMDYNDILHNYLQKLTAPQKDYVLVDEFQDLSREQVTLAERMGRIRFFVGDRKQSIFGFQGGSLSQFNKYMREKNYRLIHKNTNRRSTNNILKYSSRLLTARTSDTTIKEELEGFLNPAKADGEKIIILASDDPESAAVNKLIEMIRAGTPGDFAIIARKNSQLSRIRDMLHSKEVQFSSTLVRSNNESSMGEIMAFLRGILSSSEDDVRRALFTPFSGLSFREASELSGKLGVLSLDDVVTGKMAELRNLRTGIDTVRKALDSVILPISVSLGQEYASAAAAVSAAYSDYLQNAENFQPEHFMDFLEMAVWEAEDDLRKSRVNILSVHKSKGLEFDNVIYVPSNSTARLGFLDLVSYAIIKASAGIDVEEDLKEEPYRIDYVAMTRARERLVVACTQKDAGKYSAGSDLCQQEEDHSRLAESTSGRYDLAYSMFINGRKEEASALLNSDRLWLRNRISSYLSSISEFSFTVIQDLGDPWKFVRENILGMQFGNEYSQLGIEFHQAVQALTRGAIRAEEASEPVIGLLQSAEALLGRLPPEFSRNPLATEQRIIVPLGAFLEEEVPDGLYMKGTIDAVFSNASESSFIVLDYKTSRDKKSEYWQQIWAYCRLFSMARNVDDSLMRGAIAYVNLRKPVNSGLKENDLEIRDYSELGRQGKTVKQKLEQAVRFREDPDLFIEFLLARKPTEEIDFRLRELLL